MFDINYRHFSSLPELLACLADCGDYCLIAGGTDVMVQVRAGKRKEKLLLDVLLPELTGIRENDGYYSVGASTTLTQTAEYFRALPQPYRMLAEAAESVGSCQTRNLGTIGGNICTGNASADMATALLALDAELVVSSVEGDHVMPSDAFFIKNRTVALKKGELLREIRIPKVQWSRVGAAFVKVGKRRGHVIATLNIAGMVGLDEAGVIRCARLAGGTLAPRPIRFYESEKLLLGCAARGEELPRAVEKIQACMLTEMQPRDSKRGSKQYRMDASTAVMADVIYAACGREA